MNRALFVLVIVLSLTYLSSALAQEGNGNVEERFYNFDDMLIDGEFKTPQGFQENARQQAKFQRMSNLRKSFLPKIQESAQEDALDIDLAEE